LDCFIFPPQAVNPDPRHSPQCDSQRIDDANGDEEVSSEEELMNDSTHSISSGKDDFEIERINPGMFAVM
jgi:hypothetical protein